LTALGPRGLNWLSKKIWESIFSWKEFYVLKSDKISHGSYKKLGYRKKDKWCPGIIKKINQKDRAHGTGHFGELRLYKKFKGQL